MDRLDSVHAGQGRNRAACGGIREEVKALCDVYGTNLSSIELKADAYEAAMSHPVRVKPLATGKLCRKR